MKKTGKYIIITLVALIVLGGGALALILTAPKPEPTEEETSSTAQIALITKEEKDVSTVDVKGVYGEFTVVQSETAEEPESSAESSAQSSGEDSAAEPKTVYNYAVKGFEKYTMKDDVLQSAVKSICSLSATKELGQVENLEEYGLAGEKSTTISVNLKDGSKETLVVGIEGGETFGNYILYNGKVYIGYVNANLIGSVYESFQPFTYTVEDIDKGDGLGPYSAIEEMTLTGTNFPRDIKFNYIDEKGDYRLTSPISTDCNLTTMENLIQGIKTLTADSVVIANAVKEDLAKYGLDKPFATADFTMNGKKVKLSVSEQKVDGKRYMIANGDDTIIYTVNAADVEIWAEITSMKLRNSYVFLPMIMNVDEFTVDIGGKTHTIDMSRTKSEEKSTDTSTVYDYTGKMGGKDVEYDKITKFYSSMISIAALNDEIFTKEGKPILTFTFKYYDGGQDVLSYYMSKESDERVVALLNDEYSATVRKSSIDTFESSLNAFVEENK